MNEPMTGHPERGQPDLQLGVASAGRYRGPQRVRVITERWLASYGYCPLCRSGLRQAPNNAPAHDFSCDRCDATFELKGTASAAPARLVNGAYDALVARMQSDSHPHLFVLGYDKSSWAVGSLLVVPNFFFTVDVVAKRRPLGQKARRAGWVGCNILLAEIPRLGRIPLLENGAWYPAECVQAAWQEAERVHISVRADGRRWLLAVLNCVERIGRPCFSLADIYRYAPELSRQYPENRNVHAKLRQQLQVLRDRGVLEFLGRGQYRRVIDGGTGSVGRAISGVPI